MLVPVIRMCRYSTQSLNKVNTEVLLTSLKENGKTLAVHLAAVASSISCPSVVLIGDPREGEVLTTYRNDTGS